MRVEDLLKVQVAKASSPHEQEGGGDAGMSAELEGRHVGAPEWLLILNEYTFCVGGFALADRLRRSADHASLRGAS